MLFSSCVSVDMQQEFLMLRVFRRSTTRVEAAIILSVACKPQ